MHDKLSKEGHPVYIIRSIKDFGKIPMESIPDFCAGLQDAMIERARLEAEAREAGVNPEFQFKEFEWEDDGESRSETVLDIRSIPSDAVITLKPID